LLFSICIILIGCEKDEMQKLKLENEIENINTVSKEKAINYLKKKSSITNKQSEALEIFYEEFRYDSILNSNELMAVIPVETEYENVNSSLLLLELNGEIKEVLYHLVAVKETEAASGFTGRIVISDLNMEFISGFQVKNGKLIAKLFIAENENKNSNCDQLYTDKKAIYDGCLGATYLTGTSPDSENSNPIPYVSITLIYPNNDGGGDNDYYYSPGGGGGTSSSSDDDNTEEDKIDDSELEGKAKCIYNKLNQNSTGFVDAIKEFDGDFPVAHLKFTINNLLPSGNYGITNPPENYWIEIEMSNTQLNNISDLGGATAFVHETIHAEIYRKMLSAAQAGSLNPENMTIQEQVNYVNNLRNNFFGIYDYYVENYKPTWNHNMMAEHYIEVIADIVGEFDNNNLNPEIYEDIAWAGLRKLEDGNYSVAWNNLTESEQNRILNNLSQYFFNGRNNCN